MFELSDVMHILVHLVTVLVKFAWQAEILVIHILKLFFVQTLNL